MSDPLKILLASPEVQPFAKTGGLGDMTGALAKALSREGHDIRVILPRYKSAASGKHKILPLPVKWSVPLGKEMKTGHLFEGKLNDTIPVYFIGHDPYFFRDPLYGDGSGPYPDNAARFIFFCRSILETCKRLSFFPDIIHCSDWQTGLVPVYLKTLYSDTPAFKKTRTVFSIHNLGYQGNFWHFDVPLAGLPWDLFTPEGVEFYGKFSFLKSALVYADILTTVSPTYRREILTREYGFRMEGVLQHRAGDLHGVLNGVDYEEWAPGNDPWIKQTYHPGALKGKTVCKRDLLRLFSLDADENTPVLAMVSRLSQQKGIDLALENLAPILSGGAVLVILGAGDKAFETLCLSAARKHPRKFACKIGFSEPLAHRIIAGSDILLLPSRYEPCGLTQMYGLKYGTVPLVRSVGGLNDTIREFDPKTGKGTGFKFHRFASKYFLKAVEKALTVYQNKAQWRRLMINGMTRDNSWTHAARTYSSLYRKALQKPAG